MASEAKLDALCQLNRRWSDDWRRMCRCLGGIQLSEPTIQDTCSHMVVSEDELSLLIWAIGCCSKVVFTADSFRCSMVGAMSVRTVPEKLMLVTGFNCALKRHRPHWAAKKERVRRVSYLSGVAEAKFTRERCIRVAAIINVTAQGSKKTCGAERNRDKKGGLSSHNNKNVRGSTDLANWKTIEWFVSYHRYLKWVRENSPLIFNAKNT